MAPPEIPQICYYYAPASTVYFFSLQNVGPNVNISNFSAPQ